MVEWGYSEEEGGQKKSRMPSSSSHLTRCSEGTVGIQ